MDIEVKYNKLALHPSILLSSLIEEGHYSGPIYIKTPEKIIGLIEADAVLLYPYEWTEEEAKDWLHRDVDKFKLEDAKFNPYD